MAVRITLAGAELARVRFALAPAAETAHALALLRQPGEHAVHLPWVSWARPRLADEPDLPLLLDLLAHRSLPSFFFPVTDGRMPTLDEDLELVRAMPHDRFRAELDSVLAPDEHPELCVDPAAALARITAALRRCHDAVIAPHWGRIRTVLEADISTRAATLADRGVAGLFGELHREVAWTEGELIVNGRSRPNSMSTVDVSGHGLVLCPSVFVWPRVFVEMEPVTSGVLRYPARGLGALWQTQPSTPDALATLIGRTRAAMLGLLEQPLTTSDLAVRLGVTAGAVSQHLGVLRGANLVATRRDGKVVLHLRTERGDLLAKA
ncbi:winged helix-turn-helix transcriptional regulator [Solihabitans fulvus]|uniref:Winged helix-turn-helix transcriptional regulator n=1 Tax=Solihabitans fulvus TaxID=1892852 RepID=A0A5B2WQG3_9PSEU|nr:DUF5937 family protein [Solihabitans fulvus]KAA2252679.1 winged helix-turn-helix transcriptional regulator [Solihabitans fulvus]